MVQTYLYDWISLFFRWFHVIAGVAWIGASFYFVWLDNSLREPPEWKKSKGIKGDLWAIHGGGIYEVAKYRLGPEKMPEHLHWFKWEAYSTWLTGFAMLVMIYYVEASSYLLAGHLLTTPAMAITGSVLFLLSAVIIYEALIRSPLADKGLLFALVMVAILSVYSYAAFQLFAPRAAFLHMGALMGTIMAGNVFFGIIPAQRSFVKAVVRGEEPDPRPALLAKTRSVHNNYFTLPVIFLMISNHYAFVYAQALGWLWLILISGLMAWVRHFFNLKNLGLYRPGILVSAFAGLLMVGWLMAPRAASSAADVRVTDDQAMAIVQQHCTVCHAQTPTQPGFTAPPAGLLLETATQVKLARARVQSAAIQSHYMPLANITHMRDEERQQLAAWLAQEN